MTAGDPSDVTHLLGRLARRLPEPCHHQRPRFNAFKPGHRHYWRSHLLPGGGMFSVAYLTLALIVLLIAVVAH